MAVDSATTSDSNLYDRRTLNTNKTDLKKIRIHDFRYSCASLLINNGTNVTLVTKCLEYTKIEETLNTYSHIFSAALDSIVSIMIKI
ncbi:MAG: tyrosine-type recombinase/integrase [Bacilli bacterium]